MNTNSIQRTPQSRAFVWSAFAIIFLIQAYLLRVGLRQGTLGQVLYFLSITMALYLWITRVSSPGSFQNEFKQSIGPAMFYSVKAFAITITLLLLLALGAFSFFYIDRHFSTLNLKFIVFIHALGFAASLVVATLVGESIQRAIYNQIDKP